MGNVGLRLVIIVVRDEVFNCVMREELFELGGQLRGQGLVVGHDQCGTLNLLNDVGHAKSLATTSDAQHGLAGETFPHALS